MVSGSGSSRHCKSICQPRADEHGVERMLPSSGKPHRRGRSKVGCREDFKQGRRMENVTFLDTNVQGRHAESGERKREELT